MKYTIPEARQACDVFCVMPVALKTQDDGEVFLFLSVDVATRYIVLHEVERGSEVEYLLKHLQKLLAQPQMQHRADPFTVVLPFYDEHAAQIEALLEPRGGSLVVNEEYMAMVMNPVIDELSKHMSGGQQ